MKTEFANNWDRATKAFDGVLNYEKSLHRENDLAGAYASSWGRLAGRTIAMLAVNPNAKLSELIADMEEMAKKG